jgi:Double-GTPase 2
MTGPGRITVTMLGTTHSGKTTYLLGMYSILSVGQDGFFLHADDPDLDLELSENWDALVDEGVLPPPTPDTPKSYPFAFRSGFTRLVTVDWLDYRGGAMTDRSNAKDAAELTERLAASDSIYLTLDGEVLQDGVDERNYNDVRRRSKADRMTKFVHDAAERLSRIPSLVVLMTKFDLVAKRTPGGGAAAVERAIEAAKLVLPIAFEPGVTALICPVSLGDLGDATDGKIEPSRIAPRWLHKPMLFSMQQVQARERRARSAQAEAAQTGLQATGYELDELRRGFFAIFKGGQIAHQQAVLQSTQDRLEEERRREAQAERQARKLAEEFAELPIFIDGQRVEHAYA